MNESDRRLSAADAIGINDSLLRACHAYRDEAARNRRAFLFASGIACVMTVAWITASAVLAAYYLK